MANDKFYITSTLPYVNDIPHIGHALEFMQTDAIARYFRHKLGTENVFFNLGTDEHGAKIYKKAKDEGLEVGEYVRKTADRWKEFCKLFYVDYNHFYQTSQDPHHVKTAQEFWNKCLEKGDIYKAKYEGYYCVGCEYYKTEKDLVDGKCPLHNKEPVWLSEENYFFKLSNYTETILDFFDKNPDFVAPASKIEEARNFVKNGLTDISISRQKETLPWGIPVPNDPDHVMYVWFDALTNYVGAVGYPDRLDEFHTWWPVVQTCGPDNLRFQAIIWQGMLASAGLPFSKKIMVHSYILGPDGRKMSKTIGNVVSPFDQSDKFGAEVVRYYLLAGLPTFTDSSYKEDDLINLYNANLADNYGNLINRVVVLSKNKEVVINDISKVGAEFKNDIDEKRSEIEKSFEDFNLYEVCQKINSLLSFGNKYINDQKPWEQDKPEEILNNLSYLLLTVCDLYSPIIPESSVKAKENLTNVIPGILFKKIEA
jgi:methionyl-tRNA synthetase